MPASAGCVHLGFNSTKVRLRRCKREQYAITTHWFQFHKGSIKTIKRAADREALKGFNSTKVRLRLPPFDAGADYKTSFNSTKVRLRQECCRIFGIEDISFNSTKVRLRRITSFGVDTSKVNCFNSTKVRLRHKYSTASWQTFVCFNSTKVRLRLLDDDAAHMSHEVSIPQRFD